MKLGQEPPKIWHEMKDLTGKFNTLNSQVKRLLLLEKVWDNVVGSKGKFWKLDSVQKNTLFVKVKVVAARQELLLNREMLIKELNKHFQRAWIKEISII